MYSYVHVYVHVYVYVCLKSKKEICSIGKTGNYLWLISLVIGNFTVQALQLFYEGKLSLRSFDGVKIPEQSSSDDDKGYYTVAIKPILNQLHCFSLPSGLQSDLV